MQQEDKNGVEKQLVLSKCFQCEKDGHWVHECLTITTDQHAKLKNFSEKRRHEGGQTLCQVGVGMRQVKVQIDVLCGETRAIVESSRTQTGISVDAASVILEKTDSVSGDVIVESDGPQMGILMTVSGSKAHQGEGKNRPKLTRVYIDNYLTFIM